MGEASRISVYQVISSFRPLIGGAERATETLSRGLISHGVKTETLTAWHAGLSRSECIQEIPVRRLGVGGSGKLRALSFALHTFYWIVKHGRSVPIVHTQNIDTPLLLGMLLKLFARKHWVVTIQGEPPILAKRRTSLGRLRLRLMRRLADHFTAITGENERALLEEGISPQHISRIPNGIDTDYFRPPQLEERQALRVQYGCGPHDVILLYMGRLIFRKRVDLLLRAFAKLEPMSEAQCIVVGGGEEAESLEALALELKLGSRVRFIGPVDNVRDFYWLSDVFVLPSRFEGLPVALLESMACGMAVLVTRSPGNLQAVKDGINGLTCDIDDLDALSQRLRALVRDAQLRRELGLEARSSTVGQYSMMAVSKAHLGVYARVLTKLAGTEP
jgi:glycosyltransferase involved in cell wall biosynthesis